MALNVRIKKQYGRFCLDVDFSARPGEVTALLGASGCGKTTTLKCIAGIHRPDWGQIELDGRVLFDSDRGIDLPPQKRRVGYLFQQYALFPNMTVEQNILVCLGRLEKKKRRERARELITLLRLEGAEGLRPAQLSGGQQQRTAAADSPGPHPGLRAPGHFAGRAAGRTGQLSTLADRTGAGGYSGAVWRPGGLGQP